MNPLLEGRRKMEELFEKIEFTLAENFEVISNLLVPRKKEEMISE